MEIGRILGIVSGLTAMLISIFLEGGQVIAYMNLSAFIIIAGGCFGAVLLAVGGDEIKRAPRLFMVAMSAGNDPDPKMLIKILMDLTNIVRKEGYKGLESKLKSIKDPFLRSGIKLVVDGMSEDAISELMEYEIQNISKRHKSGAEVFNMLGGYAPTMGIIGTVLGLVNMLMHMGELGSEGLGHAVAVAFIATLYGILFANSIFLPLGSALKMKSDKELAYKKAIVKAILLLHAGENPRVLEDKVKSILGIK